MENYKIGRGGNDGVTGQEKSNKFRWDKITIVLKTKFSIFENLINLKHYLKIEKKYISNIWPIERGKSSWSHCHI